MAAIDNLSAFMAELTNVLAGLTAYLQAKDAEIAELKNQIALAAANAIDQAEVQAQLDAIKPAVDALQQIVAPAAPMA